MYYSVDRIEGEQLVLLADDGKTRLVARRLLADACEGDVLTRDKKGRFAVDAAETQRRRDKTAAQLQRLMGRAQPPAPEK